MRISSLTTAAIGFSIPLVHGLTAEAAEIKVIGATPMTAVIKELGAQFERETGHKLVTKFVSGPVVKREIDAGETFDVAISITPVIDSLIKEGKIVAATRADVAYAGVGVGVRAGAPKPDIGSVDAFKRALLNAKSVAHSAEGASGDLLQGAAGSPRNCRADETETQADVGRRDCPGRADRRSGDDRRDNVGHRGPARNWSARSHRNCSSTIASPLGLAPTPRKRKRPRR